MEYDADKLKDILSLFATVESVIMNRGNGKSTLQTARVKPLTEFDKLKLIKEGTIYTPEGPRIMIHESN